jgi:hypothetical protein
VGFCEFEGSHCLFCCMGTMRFLRWWWWWCCFGVNEAE